MLVSDKKTTPPMWKALSSKYRHRMQLGLASADSEGLKTSLNITGKAVRVYYARISPHNVMLRAVVPAIRVFVNGAMHSYSGNTNFPEIDFFLLDHALAKNKSSSKPAKASTTSNAKDKPKRDKSKDTTTKDKKSADKAAKTAKPKPSSSKSKSKYGKDQNKRIDLATLSRSKLEEV